MAALKCVLLAFLLYGVSLSNCEMSSGSGSGDSDPCADVTCVGGTCIEENGEAVCTCLNGTAIYDKPYTCEVCDIGFWGENCKVSCAQNCGGEGHFESCDAMNGDCACNECWTGETCDTAAAGDDAYACVLKYLKSVDKDLDDFGGHVPVANTDSLLGLAEELIDNDGTVVQDNTASMTVVDREEVDARPLARFMFTLNYGPGNTDYDNAVSSIKDKVKTGEIRGTLIIDESDGDSGTVTINA